MMEEFWTLFIALVLGVVFIMVVAVQLDKQQAQKWNDYASIHCEIVGTIENPTPAMFVPPVKKINECDDGMTYTR